MAQAAPPVLSQFPGATVFDQWLGLPNPGNTVTKAGGPISNMMRGFMNNPGLSAMLLSQMGSGIAPDNSAVQALAAPAFKMGQGMQAQKRENSIAEMLAKVLEGGGSFSMKGASGRGKGGATAGAGTADSQTSMDIGRLLAGALMQGAGGGNQNPFQ